MNKRIKELIDQCSEYDEMSMGIWFNKEKFAELIVKECATIVDEKTEAYWAQGTDAEWCEGKDLLKHFGVKE